MPHRFAERPNLPVSGVNGQKQKLTISKTAVKQSSGHPLITGLNKLELGNCYQPDTRKQAEKSTPTGRMKSDAPSCEASFSDQCARSLTLPERPDVHSSGPSKEMEACEYVTIFSTGKPFNTFKPFCVSNRLHFENFLLSAVLTLYCSGRGFETNTTRGRSSCRFIQCGPITCLQPKFFLRQKL